MDGYPALLIDGFKGSDLDGAYLGAVLALQSAFGNNQKTQDKLKQQLHDMKPSSQKLRSLAKFLARVNTLRRDLVHTGMTENQASTEAMATVVRVMTVPHVNTYLTARKLFGDASPSTFYLADPSTYFMDFMNWFYQQGHYVNESEDENDSGIMSDTSFVLNTRTQPTPTKSESRTSRPSVPPKQTVAKAPAPKPTERPPLRRAFKCIFCTKNHKNDFCTYDVPTRVSITERLSLCRCCLKNGHRQDECTSENTCYHCAKNGQWRQHNTALCDSPQALASRMQGLTIDWNAYRKTKKTDPGYAKYKAQLLKRLVKIPKELRAQVAQAMLKDSSDDEAMPTTLEESKDESSGDDPKSENSSSQTD